MFKAMIVDDEKSICEGLRRIIEWESCGFEVCAIARSGEEAVRLFAQHRPDLVLTDIRMQRMSGLELIGNLRAAYGKEIEFIIMSGYSDFEYARQAIRHGVSNYLLKPVDEQELHELLREAAERIAQNNDRNMNVKRVRLQQLTMGRKTEEPVGEVNWMERESAHGLQVIVVDGYRPLLWPPENNAESDGEEDVETLAVGNSGNLKDDGIPQKVLDAFSRFPDTVLGEMQVFLIREEPAKLELIAGDTLLESRHFEVLPFAGMIRDWFRASGVRVDVLVGDKVASFSQLRQSMLSIGERRETVFFGGVKRQEVLRPNPCGNSRKNTAIPQCGPINWIYGPEPTVIGKEPQRTDPASVSGLMDAIRDCRETDVTPCIQALHGQLHESGQPSSTVLVWYREIISQVMALVLPAEVFTERVAALYDELCASLDRMDLEQMMAWLDCLSHEAIGTLGRQTGLASGGVIAKVLLHVRNHYTENLDLKDLAKQFYLNPAYLGQQFRKKTGTTLKQHVNGLRMEEAMRLLLHSEMKVYEIARKVGFEDGNYFIVRFTEHTGLSPSEYRHKADA